MRTLSGVVLALALAWGGYWFIGSRALHHGAEAWFVAQSDAGFVARQEGLHVLGFPNRFDLTVDKPQFFDPASRLGWSAPFVQILALSYRPWHVIVALPPQQEVTTPLQDLTLTSDKLQASLVLAPGNPLGLDRLAIVGDGIGVASTLGWSMGAETVRVALKQVGPEGQDHDFGLEALEIMPDRGLVQDLSGLPPMIAKLRIDGTVGLAKPVAGSPSPAQPVVSGIDIKEVLLIWGDLGLYGRGRVAATPEGLAEGRIDFRVTNWQRLLPLATAAGLIDAEVRQTWENALALLAAQSGDPDDLDLPLVFSRGRMSLGPIPLGPAPRLN